MHKLEKIWISIGIITLIIFLSILGYAGFKDGLHPAGGLRTVDPTKLEETPPFDKPGLVKNPDDTYDVNIIAQAFSFVPGKLEIPKDKLVRFNVTSKDVIHSFTIVKTNINMEIVPGSINEREYTFKEPGTYLVICNEYCGAAHQMMKMEIEVVD
ncbi:MAG: cytochrome c oxidase subunit II [Bacillaceae bacterium]